MRFAVGRQRDCLGDVELRRIVGGGDGHAPGRRRGPDAVDAAAGELDALEVHGRRGRNCRCECHAGPGRLDQVEEPGARRVRLRRAVDAAGGQRHAHVAPVLAAGLHDVGLAIEAQ